MGILFNVAYENGILIERNAIESGDGSGHRTTRSDLVRMITGERLVLALAGLSLMQKDTIGRNNIIAR